MYCTWFLACLFIVFCVVNCVQSLGYELDKHITSKTLKDDSLNADKLLDEINSLKIYLEREKASRYFLQTALDSSSKHIAVLTLTLLKQQSSCTCVKQIALLKKSLLNHKTPCTCGQQINDLKEALMRRNTIDKCVEQIEVIKDVLLKQTTSDTCTKQIEGLKEIVMKEKTCSCTPEKSQKCKSTSSSTKPTTDRLDAESSLPRKEGSSKERDFTILKTISSKVSKDEQQPHLYDIVVLNQEGTDVIVVSDSNNHCMKSFWRHPLTADDLSSRLDLCQDLNYPYKIAKLNENQIAVTCFSTKIYIIDVNPSLSINTTLQTRKWNYCITSMTSQTESGNETLLVMGNYGSMSIINTEGVVMKQMNINIDGKKYPKYPYYLKLTPSGDILASDDLKYLLCITQTRELSWNYTLYGLRGVTCDAEGNVYVASYSDHKVIVLTADGVFLKEVLSSADDIKNPMGIYYDSTKRRLYIAENDSGFIKIFQHK